MCNHDEYSYQKLDDMDDTFNEDIQTHTLHSVIEKQRQLLSEKEEEICRLYEQISEKEMLNERLKRYVATKNARF
jgi:hypothetical protein